jgi:hypothetical protein
MRYTMERIFHPIGHGAFYTERFYERDNDDPSLSVVYDCGSKLRKECNLLEMSIG